MDPAANDALDSGVNEIIMITMDDINTDTTPTFRLTNTGKAVCTTKEF